MCPLLNFMPLPLIFFYFEGVKSPFAGPADFGFCTKKLNQPLQIRRYMRLKKIKIKNNNNNNNNTFKLANSSDHSTDLHC